ncbi:MAG: ArnT family glycosyltransferase [Solirubrobacteraceae bacterium]
MSARGRRLVLAIGVLYVVSRLALLWRFPTFWDEGGLAVRAQTGLDDPATRFIFLADDYGPLFHWISIVLISLGMGPLTAVRGIAFLSGGVTLALCGLIARKLFDSRTAVAAMALYVAMPFFVVHDVHASLDTLAAALAMAVLYTQLRLAQRPRLDLALIYGLLLGAGLLNRQVALLGLLLAPASLVLFEWTAPDRRPRLLRWGGFTVLAFALAGLIHSIELLAPNRNQLPALLAQIHHFRPLGAALRDPFALVPQNWPGFGGALWGYVTWPLLLLLAGVCAVAARARELRVGLLALWAAGPIFAGLLLVQFGYARYIMSAIAPLTILIALGGVRAARCLGARAPRRWVALAAALLLLPALVSDARVLASPATARLPGEDDWQFVGGWPAGTGLDRIAAALQRRLPARGTLTTIAGIDFTPFNLASRYEHPVLIQISPNPSADGVSARWRGRALRFLPAGTPGTGGAQFVLQHSTFGLPRGLSLAGYRLVSEYVRPRGGTVQGRQQPRTAVQLYERVR